MNDKDFARLRHYMQPLQKVRLDTDLFSPREKSGIVNGLTQGFWLSNGKIAWLADDLATTYELPFIRLKQGSYGFLQWNTEAAKLDGMKDALTALLAYVRLTDGELHTYDRRLWNDAIADPKTHNYVRVRSVSDVVRAQFLKLNEPFKDRVDVFLNDWKENNVWVRIT